MQNKQTNTEGARSMCTSAKTTHFLQKQNHKHKAKQNKQTKTEGLTRAKGFSTSARRMARLLLLAGAPLLIIQFVVLMGNCPLSDQQDIDQTEFYAGVREVTKAAWRHKRTAWAFEKNDDEITSNMMTTNGFIHAAHMTMRMKDIANGVLAPVCSSWTKLNKGTSCRSKDSPNGNTRLAYVREANCMVSRTMILVWMQSACKNFVVVEQPITSYMQYYGRFKEWMDAFDVTRAYVNLEWFGAPHDKKIYLYSPYKWITEIVDFTTHDPGWSKKLKTQHEVSHNTVDKRGKKSYHGGKDLKQTQAYPRGFGEAIQKLFERHRPEVEAAVRKAEQALGSLDMSNVIFKKVKDKWTDAELGSVWKELC
jgi:hypothetical protein